MKNQLKTAALFAFCPLFLSCASKQELEGGDHAAIYAASHSPEESLMRCNVFSDDTFQGIVAVEEDPNDSKICAQADFISSPPSLLKSGELFLQAYPFAVKRGKMSYGPSLDIEIYERQGKSPLITSKIIDQYLAEKKLETDKKSFFSDHYFRFCGVTSEWDGMQLVIYLRREEGKSAPLRITKFLLPPFLSHPGHFKEEKGSILAAFHPFLSEGAAAGESEDYYKLGQKLCKDNDAGR